MNLSHMVMLEGLVVAFQEKLGPVLAHDSYATEQLRLMNVLVGLTAAQIDSIAAIRIAENSAMRALFADAAGQVDATLGAQLREAAMGSETGYRISELDAGNAGLRTLLVALHSAVDARTDPAAQEIGQRIWRMLQDFDESRG